MAVTIEAAIRELVAARFACGMRSEPPENIEAAASEAATLTAAIEPFRALLGPADSPDALARAIGAARRQ
jgi:hypothetical protein